MRLAMGKLRETFTLEMLDFTDTVWSFSNEFGRCRINE